MEQGSLIHHHMDDYAGNSSWSRAIAGKLVVEHAGNGIRLRWRCSGTIGLVGNQGADAGARVEGGEAEVARPGGVLTLRHGLRTMFDTPRRKTSMTRVEEIIREIPSERDDIRDARGARICS